MTTESIVNVDKEMLTGSAQPVWRYMYDGISADVPYIPRNAQMVAGYVPPSVYAWSPGDWARFPGVPHVRITVAGSEPDAKLASVVDVERGAFSPSQARLFVRQRNAFRPDTATVYVDEASLNDVLNACAGINYWIWLAWYIMRPPTAADVAGIVARLRPGVRLAAWQYTTGQHYDLSAVINPDWHPS